MMLAIISTAHPVDLILIKAVQKAETVDRSKVAIKPRNLSCTHSVVKSRFQRLLSSTEDEIGSVT